MPTTSELDLVDGWEAWVRDKPASGYLVSDEDMRALLALAKEGLAGRPVIAQARNVIWAGDEYQRNQRAHLKHLADDLAAYDRATAGREGK